MKILKIILSFFTKVSSSTIQRRFNFAPARLFGPLPVQTETEKEKFLQSNLPKITWIKKWTHGIIPFYIDSNTYGKK